jgi:predicted TPR repeat methyltransferase
MTDARNKLSWVRLASEMETLLYDAFIKRPMAWLAEARLKIRNLPKTNFDMGCNFFERGLWMDAAFRFRITLYLQPDSSKAWYNLGCCYFRMGKIPQAEKALRRAFSLAPNDPEVVLMLAMVAPNALPLHQRPQTLPSAMVTGFFSNVASRYDAFELQNQYRGGIAVEQHVRPLLGSRALNVVDLGCGSGIAARPWRGDASQIIGVDLTPAMAAQAEAVTINNQKLYDAVVVADMRALPDALPEALVAESADLVLAVNVAQFVGELAGLMRGAARLLKAGGCWPSPPSHSRNPRVSG